MLDGTTAEASEHFSFELSGVQPAALEVPSKVTFEGDHLVVEVGDVERARKVWHEQGDNSFRYQGTCGLASIAGTLRMLGMDVTEREVVDYAVTNGLCEVTSDLETCGATGPAQLVQIFKHFGVPAHAEVIGSFEQVTSAIDRGQGVLIGLNAGELWMEELQGNVSAGQIVRAYGDGNANHAIEVVGYERDPQTNQVVGVFVNDTGTPAGAARLISAQSFARAAAHGVMVVTDLASAHKVA